ncbi:MAG: HlyC/CorC family transporter [Anaerolineaceae bacterium]|nr:HlyC/CorC family transporter [Anaerolineaceae bacterium]
MTFLVDFLIIFLLILLNGMFVSAEFSIIGVRPTRIAQLAEEGHSTAKRVQRILNSPAQIDRYIASAQLGITLASLGLGMYGEPAIGRLIEEPLHELGLSAEAIHTISFFAALGIITYFHVVIGEMVPKSLALQRAERTVLMLSTPMFLMQSVFSWAITALNKIGVFVLWVLRTPPPDEGERLHTPDELELIISDSVVGGLIEAEEEELLHNIFDFADLQVGQIMTPRSRLDAVPVSIGKADLLEKMFASRYSRFPVYDHDLDHILGIVHLKDMVHHHVDDAPYELRDLLHDVPFVPDTLPADKLLTLLKQRHIHMAIVIDEYGGTAGIVTLEDLLEEVVGEVRDEFDSNERDSITVIEPGYLMALGATRLDELEPYMDLGDDERIEEVDTVGGLMVANLPLPPQIGGKVTINNITFRAEAVDGLRVERVSVRYEPANSPKPPTTH